MLAQIKKVLYAVFVGEQPPPPGYERANNQLRPIGTRHCSTCNKFIPNEVSCNYDLSGNCTAGDFIWTRDGVVPRSGRAAAQDAESALKRLNESLRRGPFGR